MSITAASFATPLVTPGTAASTWKITCDVSITNTADSENAVVSLYDNNFTQVDSHVVGTGAVGSDVYSQVFDNLPGGTYRLWVFNATGDYFQATSDPIVASGGGGGGGGGTAGGSPASTATPNQAIAAVGEFLIPQSGGALVAPTITSANVATIAAGATFTPSATGSTPIAWSAATLPGSITINTATGAVTPTAAGVFSFTYTAANGTAPNATQAFTLTVTSGVTIALSPDSFSVTPGEQRLVVISVKNGGAPVVGRACPTTVLSGPATVTTPAVTNADGQTSFILTSTGVGRIEVQVL